MFGRRKKNSELSYQRINTIQAKIIRVNYRTHGYLVLVDLLIRSLESHNPGKILAFTFRVTGADDDSATRARSIRDGDEVTLDYTDGRGEYDTFRELRSVSIHTPDVGDVHPTPNLGNDPNGNVVLPQVKRIPGSAY